VLRKIFGSKREEVRRECRKLHNEELYDLYSSTNIIRAIKSRRLRCVRHVFTNRRRDNCIQGFGGEI